MAKDNPFSDNPFTVRPGCRGPCFALEPRSTIGSASVTMLTIWRDAWPRYHLVAYRASVEMPKSRALCQQCQSFSCPFISVDRSAI